jgi:hypothetical protein
LTKDYTKLFKKKDGTTPSSPLKPASAPLSRKAEKKEQAKHICTQCYEIGNPSELKKGSWTNILLKIWIIFGGIFLVAWYLTGSTQISFIIATFGLILPSNYGFKPSWISKEDGNSSSILSSLEIPTTLLRCKKCGHPNSMVEIDSREGQDAMFFALKKDKPKQSF